MYISVYDLDDDQIDELKEAMWDTDDAFEGDVREEYEWWSLIPRCVVEEHYKDISFTEDDFWCSCNKED